MEFKLNHRYRSYRDGVHYGPWEAGEIVELTEEDAEWVERDSPGALSPVKAKSSGSKGPAADRQAKPAANRAGS